MPKIQWIRLSPNCIALTIASNCLIRSHGMVRFVYCAM